jgi:hypothetical protein
MKRILLFPDAPPGDGGAPPVEATQTAEQINAPVVGRADAPPAATIVVETPPSESERKLQEQLDAEKAELKKREMRVMDLEDENRKLKDVTPPAAAKKKPGKGSWGLIQFEE